MEKYLRKCLDSLIVSDENMQRLEVLVINDGSKDTSSQIAHEYENKYSQTFRVIDKENGNYGSCVNQGLINATGKFIKILDADDSLSNDTLDYYLSYLKEQNVDLVITDYCLVDESNQVTETYSFDLPIDRAFSMNEFKKGAGWLWHHGITYKTDNLIKMGYSQTEGISYTDDEWIFKPMIMVRTVSYFPHFLYFYLRGREGQTFDPKVMRRTFSQRLKVVNSIVSFYIEHGTSVKSDVKRYLDIKLFSRTRALYNLFLIKGGNQNESQDLSSFCELDKKIKDFIPDIYNKLDNVHNSLGWYYIRKWRKAGYNTQLLILKILRLKYRLYHYLGINVFNTHMPNNLKRPI